MKKYYFAHNFNDRKKFRELELRLEKEMGIELYNPFYDDPERLEEMKELDAIAINAEDRIKSFEKGNRKAYQTPENLVKRDLTALASCDGLFTIVDSPSFGTAIEMCNAVLMKKTIIFISEKFINHPWIKVYADYRFSTITDFINYYFETEGEFSYGRIG